MEVPNNNSASDPSRLKGYLRMLEVEEPLPYYSFDGDQLQDSQNRLERRKKLHVSNTAISIQKSFVELVTRHRFVCFFLVQGGGSQNVHHSPHTLALRKTLALKFHNHMTILVVFCGQGNNTTAKSLFCQGTGFASFPSSSTLMTMLNIAQVPSLVIVDTATGRPISADAALAVEWNDPQEVLDAWEQEQSGLSSTQKVFSVVTLQSNCTIS